MKVISREHVSCLFDPRTPAVESASVGERVIFQTRDHLNDEIHSEQTLADTIEASRMKPCTGPLYVQGAKPGDVLAVRIEEIKLRRWGVLTLLPDKGLFLDKLVTSPLTRIVAINQEKGYVEYEPNIRVKLRPHVGTIATTPNMILPTGKTGIHGGNMGINRLGPGAVIYFPVFVDGAKLSLGNVHANMGDAGICIGVETGADVQVYIERIYRGIYLPAPIIETSDHWISYSDSPYGKDGVVNVCRRMAEFISNRTNSSLEDITLLMSIAGDIHIAQLADADHNHTFYLEFPKDVFTDGRLGTFAPTP